MRAPSAKTILILGAGPGIGRSVATQFASRGYTNVVLIARRAHQLALEKAAVEDAVPHVQVKTYTLDTTKTKELTAALDDADATFGKPEVVFYNAARVLPSLFFEHPVEDVEYDLKITVSALYHVAQRYLPHLVSLAGASTEGNKPALIVTNSALPHHPIPQLFALSLVKAAQRNLVQSLHLEFAAQGVHIGVITVAGQVLVDDEVRNPTNIAKRTWEWFAERTEGKGEVEAEGMNEFEVVI